jgi:hypothetical protein
MQITTVSFCTSHQIHKDFWAVLMERKFNNFKNVESKKQKAEQGRIS